MFNSIGEIAKILNYLCFIFSVVAVAGYYISVEKRKWFKIGYYSYFGSAVGITLMFFLLLFLIVKHQYQYTYVFHNSSNELSFGLLLSSSFAGQEGSFLLWSLFLVIIGLILIPFTRKRNCESEVMGTYSFILSFLLLMIINKSPFDKVWETYPEAIKTGIIQNASDIINLSSNSFFVIPLDGNGLNPLLQNFWMQIHPPILFIGFALMAVPFVFAISALLQKDYKNWLNKTLPWIISASAILGLGIILGGFWAYETLGWGGYWGWDPVENSSLIPWMVSIALIHTAYNQKKTGGLIKTNLFLSILGFILVIYSTFLTRSGILSNSSVHSFTEPGTTVYLILIIFLFVFVFYGFGLLLYRRKDLSGFKMEYKFLSRETALSIGSLIILISALMIFTGTSYPILFKSNVDISFYNNWNLPLAILLILMNGYSLVLVWKETKKQEIFKKAVFGLFLSLIAAIITYIYGVKDLMFILLVWSSFFALFINIQKLLKVIKGSPFKTGAFISHMGVALLFLGIVGSGRYSNSVNVKLPKDIPVITLGYSFTYLGEEKFDNDRKSYFNVKIEKDNESEIMKPVMFINAVNNSVMKIPYIKSSFQKDVYFSPVDLEMVKDDNSMQTLELEKEIPVKYLDYKITLLSHDFGEQTMSQMMKGEGFEIQAKIEIEYKSGEKEILNPVTKFGKRENDIKIVKTKDSLISIGLLKITSNSSSGIKAFINVGKSIIFTGSQDEALIAEISIKPFISVFWTGNIFILIGFTIAIIKRWREIRLK